MAVGRCSVSSEALALARLALDLQDLDEPGLSAQSAFRIYLTPTLAAKCDKYDILGPQHVLTTELENIAMMAEF